MRLKPIPLTIQVSLTLVAAAILVPFAPGARRVDRCYIGQPFTRTTFTPVSGGVVRVQQGNRAYFYSRNPETVMARFGVKEIELKSNGTPHSWLDEPTQYEPVRGLHILKNGCGMLVTRESRDTLFNFASTFNPVGSIVGVLLIPVTIFAWFYVLYLRLWIGVSKLMDTPIRFPRIR